jgi:hypothetical protein
MKPMHIFLRGWEQVGAFVWRAGAGLILLLGLGVAHADTTNFVGAFAPVNWTNEPPGLGAVYFTNSDSELVLTGPNQPASQVSSFDPISYNGPLQGGLTVGGTLQFHWEYNAGDTLSTISGASFAWTLGGGGGTTQTNLASGGTGTIASGDFFSLVLTPGTTFSFLLSTETPANKLSGTLVITDFQFNPNVPEPSTGALFAGMIAMFGIARWRRLGRLC